MGGMVSQLTSGLWIEGLGYEAPYWFILSCFLASVVYVIFFVRESRPRTTETRACLFNLRSLRRVWHVYRNPRDGARKNLVILFICCGLIVLTTMGYSGVMLLYLVGSPLCFGPERIGYFFAARYTIVGLGAVLGIKLLGRCLTELTITRIGMVTLMASLVLFGFSKTAWVVFMGGCDWAFVSLPFPSTLHLSGSSLLATWSVGPYIWAPAKLPLYSPSLWLALHTFLHNLFSFVAVVAVAKSSSSLYFAYSSSCWFVQRRS